jgi:hypothetical protein
MNGRIAIDSAESIDVSELTVKYNRGDSKVRRPSPQERGSRSQG